MKIPRFSYRFDPKHDLPLVAVGVLVALLGVQLVSLVSAHQTPLPYQPGGITSPWVPTTVKHWQATIDNMAKRYDIDPNYVAIIMTLESGGDATAKSEAGAQGLMQITNPTASDIAKRYLKTPVQKYDLMKPATNIEFGTAYLAKLRDIYGDSKQGPDWTLTTELIADAYNGGFSAANSVLNGTGLHDTQTVVYARDAFNMWRERNATSSPTFDRWKERGGSILIDNAKNTRQPSVNS